MIPEYYPTDPSDEPGPSPLVTCSLCSGTGGDVKGGTCLRCRGSGSVKREEERQRAFPPFGYPPGRGSW